ncbi:rhodanese-like domain-containing protein [Candidatus Saccharibacteria bacterium]|nr:rhodanese-like domain-containing protein [Candidatus Saccharibacteria bacterium]
MSHKIIIDVREPFEYSMGHVEGAVNIPPSRLLDNPPELEDLPKETEIVVYCISGSRSNATIPYLRRMGFTNITNGINRQHVEKNFPPHES